MAVKNRTPFSSTLRNDLFEQLTNYSDNTDVPKSKLFDQAIELLLLYKGVGTDSDNIEKLTELKEVLGHHRVVLDKMIHEAHVKLTIPLFDVEEDGKK